MESKDLAVVYKQVFTSDSGKLVLEDMMKAHYVMKSTFGGDPFETARREGERNTILRILTILDLDMDELVQMMLQERSK